MKIAIVDDEPDCLNHMKKICDDFGSRFLCPIETVAFRNGESFLTAFRAETFSIVFMDIYLEGIDGIAAALKMRNTDSSCLLIFLTSSMEFMPEAFSCHAFEYIVKPVSRQRIFDVLSDAQKVLPQTQKYIELVNDRKTVRVPLDGIVSVVTDAHYLDITLTDQTKLRCRMTMPEFVNKTESDARFIPINKGIAVNAGHIRAFENCCCIMESGARFPVRIRDKIKIEQAAWEYNFNKIRSRQRRRKDD